MLKATPTRDTGPPGLLRVVLLYALAIIFCPATHEAATLTAAALSVAAMPETAEKSSSEEEEETRDSSPKHFKVRTLCERSPLTAYVPMSRKPSGLAHTCRKLERPLSTEHFGAGLYIRC